ncbi:flagellar assembly protein FliW [Bdellovibrio svalbardensis]|uniref:Flagellar assembly factor FliW n=1 Tax=Bdellovibrio svalbardensis TaxID=2972972 RepID=A0ABT6DJJ2_9BACT|nr:flagellar assembly protein FliW [Bdellovibrio svalbardensis]MDG0817005.1 flagellar assembly protein FliW [Bdellovibrio svalbardensis]
MIISTSRFGQIELKEEDVLTFPEGMLGFADLRKFALLDDPNDEIFAWLQSCEAPQIAFPVLEPELFAPQYKASLTKSDMEALKLSGQDKARYFSIVTIPDDPTQMTANLKAPVVVNVAQKIARQCVLQDNNLAIREPIFTKLQQRVVQNPAVAIKNQTTGIDVATKLHVVKDAEL